MDCILVSLQVNRFFSILATTSATLSTTKDVPVAVVHELVDQVVITTIHQPPHHPHPQPPHQLFHQASANVVTAKAPVTLPIVRIAVLRVL